MLHCMTKRAYRVFVSATTRLITLQEAQRNLLSYKTEAAKHLRARKKKHQITVHETMQLQPWVKAAIILQ